MKTKHLILTLLIASFFTACATTKKVEQQTPFTMNNEVNSKELFENKENWKAINKNNNQDFKNFEKEVK